MKETRLPDEISATFEFGDNGELVDNRLPETRGSKLTYAPRRMNPYSKPEQNRQTASFGLPLLLREVPETLLGDDVASEYYLELVDNTHEKAKHDLNHIYREDTREIAAMCKVYSMWRNSIKRLQEFELEEDFSSYDKELKRSDNLEKRWMKLAQQNQLTIQAKMAQHRAKEPAIAVNINTSADPDNLRATAASLLA